MCFSYDDYAEMCESKVVTCRKPHRCCGCHRQIAVGETANASSGKFDGSFFRAYECEDCRRLILSIAAEEIEHGCSWNESWCAAEGLSEYIAERSKPVVVLGGSLEDCWSHVNELWKQKVEQRLPNR